MKLLTIDSREVAGRPGALLDTGEIVDLVAAPSSMSESQWIPHSIVSVLHAGREGLLHVNRILSAVDRADEAERERLQARGALLPFAGTALLAPIRRPGLILVVDSESNAYIKSPNTAVGNDATVKAPWSRNEAIVGTGMLAAVLGRAIFQVDVDTAEEAIAGYTLLIDLSTSSPGAGTSVPEWRHYMETKQFPGASPMGPVVVTKDEIDDPAGLTASAQVNGIDLASGRLYPDDLDIGATLADLSQRYAFRPGDLVAIDPSTATGPGQPIEIGPGDRFSMRLGSLAELEVKIVAAS
jgi:2-keto-4-pentenoate hydratase/2-oxohepta-3-ene-1,7-dioic acid hydratase in catechol pathway